ncbi:MAG: hypothetical protein BSOLF_0988 [Candidatus Carbobacillus altaicus]|uniref:Uncharacterized protein n=1 Tax=Candidatus Carbonibacillus altaicus TaxID=2163959 RepID=A0A2R6XX80_9BACL|nr:MAG: hypothetical protein BSOLF_1072 [Candidatus Carbobacillus altaicus]PTQ55030.1 MAG: hypothetical protein BSOLF_0988 [Candidatus Carbobacillus altaicus]
MANYLVRAQIDVSRQEALRERLIQGEIERLKPFGRELSASLEEARLDPETGEVLWEEACYCRVPLAEEREAVLDRYFTRIDVERVSSGEGWAKIAHLPSFWRPLTVISDGPVCDFSSGSCDEPSLDGLSSEK